MGNIAQLILQELPSIINLVQQRHAENNPTAPPLTAEQVHEAFTEAFTSTIAKDEIIKAMNAPSS